MRHNRHKSSLWMQGISFMRSAAKVYCYVEQSDPWLLNEKQKFWLLTTEISVYKDVNSCTTLLSFCPTYNHALEWHTLSPGGTVGTQQKLELLHWNKVGPPAACAAGMYHLAECCSWLYCLIVIIWALRDIYYALKLAAAYTLVIVRKAIKWSISAHLHHVSNVLCVLYK